MTPERSASKRRWRSTRALRLAPSDTIPPCSQARAALTHRIGALIIAAGMTLFAAPARGEGATAFAAAFLERCQSHAPQQACECMLEALEERDVANTAATQADLEDAARACAAPESDSLRAARRSLIHHLTRAPTPGPRLDPASDPPPLTWSALASPSDLPTLLTRVREDMASAPSGHWRVDASAHEVLYDSADATWTLTLRFQRAPTSGRYELILADIAP